MTEEDIQASDELLNKITDFVGINKRFGLVIIAYDYEKEVISTKANTDQDTKATLIAEAYNNLKKELN